MSNTNSQTERCGNIKVDGLYLKHHNGLDIYALPGTSLKAVIKGKVTYQASSGMAGNKVKLSGKTETGESILYVYCHVEKMEDSLTDGADVSKGDIIAIAGATGNAANVDYKHCHLTIYVNGEECDKPDQYLKTKFDADGNPNHDHITPLVKSN